MLPFTYYIQKQCIVVYGAKCVFLTIHFTLKRVCHQHNQRDQDVTRVDAISTDATASRRQCERDTLSVLGLSAAAKKKITF